MLSSVAKWGNSLAIRLPKKLSATARIQAGTQLTISLQRGRIILEKPAHDLRELVAGITAANRSAEVSTGQVTGQELW